MSLRLLANILGFAEKERIRKERKEERAREAKEAEEAAKEAAEEEAVDKESADKKSSSSTENRVYAAQRSLGAVKEPRIEAECALVAVKEPHKDRWLVACCSRSLVDLALFYELRLSYSSDLEPDDFVDPHVRVVEGFLY